MARQLTRGANPCQPHKLLMHSLPYKGRAPLLGSRAMTQIARFATVFAAAIAFAGSALADPYRVKDLVVDKVAPTPSEAIQQGRNDARLMGAQRLIERLTLAEDRSSARQPLEPADVARLYLNVVTQ